MKVKKLSGAALTERTNQTAEKKRSEMEFKKNKIKIIKRIGRGDANIEEKMDNLKC